jgi:molecular chaperone HtpG
LTEAEFIKSVDNVIPNPSFEIVIESQSQKISKDEHSFLEFKASALKDHSWSEHSNIRNLEIDFRDPAKGFVGSIIIGVLESHGEPSSSVEMTSKSIEIDNETYNLDKSISVSSNEISESTASITIDEDGSIEQSSSYQTLCKSISRLSLHGIVVSSTLFPASWNMQRNQVKLNWPFPMLIVVDICGSQDLDLNSSRTQIIMSDKWNNFEEMLALETLKQIKSKVSIKYWDKLKYILSENTKNEIFIRCLNSLD